MKVPLNEQIKTALNLATSVVFDMDDAGVAVLDVEIIGSRPVLVVDREPPGATPAHKITTPCGRNLVTLQVAELRGCRVQWESSRARVNGAT
jgi:hypothetical protein